MVQDLASLLAPFALQPPFQTRFPASKEPVARIPSEIATAPLDKGCVAVRLSDYLCSARQVLPCASLSKEDIACLLSQPLAGIGLARYVEELPDAPVSGTPSASSSSSPPLPFDLSSFPEAQGSMAKQRLARLQADLGLYSRAASARKAPSFLGLNARTLGTVLGANQQAAPAFLAELDGALALARDLQTKLQQLRQAREGFGVSRNHTGSGKVERKHTHT